MSTAIGDHRNLDSLEAVCTPYPHRGRTITTSVPYRRGPLLPWRGRFNTRSYDALHDDNHPGSVPVEPIARSRMGSRKERIGRRSCASRQSLRCRPEGRVRSTIRNERVRETRPLNLSRGKHGEPRCVGRAGELRIKADERAIAGMLVAEHQRGGKLEGVRRAEIL